MRPVTFMSAALVVSTFATLPALTGCQRDEITAEEAREAVAESSIDSQAAALVGNTVEIGTTFTVGKAAKEAATELRSFVASQMPCADVTLSEATLTIEYGARAGACTYRGNTYSGKHAITIAKNEDAQVLVEHTWTDLSNGKVKLSGTASVTWDARDQYRKVDHELTWTFLKNGKTGTSTGSRTQRPLGGGLAEGWQVDGSQSFEGSRGRFDLAIEGVQWRWRDPVPQSGRYVLATPKGKSITLSFARVDDDTIEVTIAGPKRDFKFRVTSEGDVGES